MFRIGYISAATGRPPSEIARHSTYELMFWEHALKNKVAEEEKRYWEKFGRHMGTVWYRSDFEEKKGVKGSKAVPAEKLKNPDMLFYPHALLTSPNGLFKQIRNDFENTKPKIAGGEYRPEAGEEIVETAELSYEEFREFFDTFSSGLGVGGG